MQERFQAMSDQIISRNILYYNKVHYVQTEKFCKASAKIIKNEVWPDIALKQPCNVN